MKNRLLSKLTDNPILSIATAITALVAAVDRIKSFVGLPPFWSDLLISIILLGITIYWIKDLWKESSGKPQSGFHSGKRSKITLKERIKNVGIFIIILPLLLILTVWNMYPVISHFYNYKWTLCGQFIVKNPRQNCLYLYDTRNRLIYDKCYRLDDDTGYKFLNMPNWWTYKPQAVAVKNQANISEKKELESKMFDSSDCSGFIKLP